MMPPGHLAVTWGVATLWRAPSRSIPQLDYRWLAVCAIGPDLIDKPLAMTLFPEAQTSQLIAHALIPNVVLLLTTLLFMRALLPYVATFTMHLVADRMWNHTESFFWPLYGWDVFWRFKPMDTPEAMFNVYLDIITQYPQVWVIELLAVLYLLGFTWRYQMYRWATIKRLVLTGRLTVGE